MKQDIRLLVGIIADDLTSATDGASSFLGSGYTPLIKRGSSVSGHASIVSIDTNSRTLSADEAGKVTADAVHALRQAGILYKTIDSTLRGHIRAEIAAAFTASGRRRLVVAPAFPEAGRVTVDGIQFVNGIPVNESVYGRDPVHPARTSRISDLIDPSLGSPVVLGCKRSDTYVPDAAILVLDADSQDALNQQVASIPDPETVLWVGSPGLAIALASLVTATPEAQPVTVGTANRVLIVAGSANPVSREQCETLRREGVSVVTQLTDAPIDARMVCLQAPQQRQDPAAVLTDLATQASAAITRNEFDAVIATGGETMAAILDRIGISQFYLSREIEPGFPIGHVKGEDGQILTIAMKAGGFGSPSTLHNAAHEILGKRISKGSDQ